MTEDSPTATGYQQTLESHGVDSATAKAAAEILAAEASSEVQNDRTPEQQAVILAAWSQIPPPSSQPSTP